MILDTFLIAQAEMLANGRYVHKVQNMVAAYRVAYELALDSGCQEDVDIFLAAQKEIRQFINRRKVDKTDLDEYDLDIMKSAS